MISLLDEDQKELGRFSRWSQVVDYIHKIQVYQLKYLTYCKLPFQEKHAELLETAWRFVYYRQADLTTIYASFKEDITPTVREKQAFDQGHDLIEIYKGDLMCIQVSVPVDLDISLLEKDWCQEYCEAHGYLLLESLDKKSIDDNSSKASTTGGADDLVI